MAGTAEGPGHALPTQGAEQIAKTWMLAPAPEAAAPLTVQAV
jgi:hypothetical protein